MLERMTAEPLYQQAYDILLRRINSGEYEAGKKIPSENELCNEFKISRMTVRLVLKDLVRDGKIYRVQGKGTFVAKTKFVAGSTSYVGIREQLEKQGYDVKTSLVNFEIIKCSVNLASIMKLEKDEEVYSIIRIRSVKDEPLSLSRSYVPARLSPNLEKHDVCGEQLCKILSSNYGLNRKKVIETLESISARKYEAELLNIRRGHPLLRLCDIISDEDGNIFEYSSLVFRGDRMQIRLQYEA